MIKTEAEAVGRIVNQLRPDWPTQQVITIIGRDHQHRPMRDVLVALVWVATDPDSKTPARVTEDGPWWRAAAAQATIADKPTRMPVRTREACPTHPGYLRQRCAGCRADSLAAPGPVEYAELGITARQLAETPRPVLVRDRLADAWDQGRDADSGTANPYRRSAKDES